MVESGRFVAASVAPSFAAVFTGWQRNRLPSALRALGFRYVGQTSQGAYQVSAHMAKLMEGKTENPHRHRLSRQSSTILKSIVTTSSNLMPLVSPMAAHARMLKNRLGEESAVVFIGPCVAKKSEILRPDVAGAVDCVLTFKELAQWMEQRNIDLSMCEESDFDEKPIHGPALPPAGGEHQDCRPGRRRARTAPHPGGRVQT